MRRKAGALLCFLLLSVAAGATAAPAAAPAAVQQSVAHYTVAMPKPATHLYEVTARFDAVAPTDGYVDLHMPVWTPGSYLVREFERNVQDFSARSGSRDARWEKVDKDTWRVWTAEGARDVEARYRVYANELSVRTSHLDASHGYFNGANLFLYTDASLRAPARLTVEAPRGWHVSTALDPTGPPVERAGATATTYAAPDFDILVDSPVEIGTHARLTFEALGKPHEIAIWGEGNYDAKRLVDDFKKIVEAAEKVVGDGLPYERYVFVVHLYPGGGGGLEHLASTTVESGPYLFTKKESYTGFLGLIAHEYFHLWLVKRIRPVPLGPFDYSRENYTKMLWLMEGGTDYYANVILRRAGLLAEDQYWEELAKSIKSLQQTPGRRHMSLESASYDAWVKYYRRSEHSINDQISYYTKGAIVSAMLDLAIAQRTNGKKSLDDVLRYLWTTYTKKGAGVPEDAVQPAVEAVAGGSFEEFFDKYVRGTDEIAYDTFLAHEGRRLVTEVTKPTGRVDASRTGAWLGAGTFERNGRLVVSYVLEDSPAWESGLNADDEIVAVDGLRATSSSLVDRIADRMPGESVKLVVFRRDTLREIPVKLGAPQPDVYKIEKIKKEESKPATGSAATGP
jgi:predicted metalloprotease with PDZ domain